MDFPPLVLRTGDGLDKDRNWTAVHEQRVRELAPAGALLAEHFILDPDWGSSSSSSSFLSAPVGVGGDRPVLRRRPVYRAVSRYGGSSSGAGVSATSSSYAFPFRRSEADTVQLLSKRDELVDSAARILAASLTEMEPVLPQFRRSLRRRGSRSDAEADPGRRHEPGKSWKPPRR